MSEANSSPMPCCPVFKFWERNSAERKKWKDWAEGKKCVCGRPISMHCDITTLGPPFSARCGFCAEAKYFESPDEAAIHYLENDQG